MCYKYGITESSQAIETMCVSIVGVAAPEDSSWAATPNTAAM